MEMPQVYRPIPRRNFEITPPTPDVSTPPSLPDSTNPERLSGDKWSEKTSAPSRSASILNLTSSTLLGIYSKTTTDGPRDDISTPWGTGAQTPSSNRHSIDGDLLTARLNNDAQRLRVALKKRKKGLYSFYLPLFAQTSLLFFSGIAFGMLVTHLQRTQQIAPVPVPSTTRKSWYYQLAWGLLGVLIGNALPIIDVMMKDDEALVEGDYDVQKPKVQRTRSNASDKAEYDRRSLVEGATGPLWYSTVRSVGAFVGIAFAVRRVPWQSTLQVSLTLAIANPVLWYLIDRSKSGFALSTAVGVVGTFLLLLVKPDFVPVPAIHHDQVSDQLGVYTWLASILFCTSLCFGAIGRKLQL